MTKRKQVTHAEALRYICERLDASSDSERCRAIKKHLESCTDCSHELDSLRKTIALFKAYPEQKLSAAAKAGMFKKIVSTGNARRKM